MTRQQHSSTEHSADAHRLVGSEHQRRAHSDVVPLHADFRNAAKALNPLLYRALVDDIVDADDMALVKLLGCSLQSANRLVLRRRGAIPPEGCVALRKAVDAERDVTRDSVDRMAQHQLNVDAERLTTLIGRTTVASLWGLADELLASQRADVEARARACGAPIPEAAASVETADGGFHVDCFLRRYTRETRPYIGFHRDISTVTVNVALNADAAFEGGRLHAILDGRHSTISRVEGEATAHGDDVMHGVSAMRSGVRYSCILFFYALKNDPESAAFQTIPANELADARRTHGGEQAISAADERERAANHGAGAADGLLRRADGEGGSGWEFVLSADGRAGSAMRDLTV